MPKETIVIDTLTVSPNEILRIATLNMLSNTSQLTERLEQLKNEIIKYDFDIIALQEFNHAKTDEIIVFFAELGYPTFHVNEPTTTDSGIKYGVATFSKYENVFFTTIKQNVEGSPELAVHALDAYINYNNQNVHIINAHFSWGGNNSWVRLRQAELINEYVQKLLETSPEDVFLLVGDLNTLNESSTLRYLKGLQEGTYAHSGAYWVDAWDIHGTTENEITSNPDTYWGASTAATKNLMIPSLIPKRRIDYILSYGWCYGKQGYPLNFSRFADENTIPEISDHYGIWSDIYIPKKN